MIQILYTFVGVLIAFGVILLIGYLISYNSRVDILEDKISRLDAQFKDHIDDDDLHHGSYANDFQFRVNQLNSRVNDIWDELDSLKLEWEEEFDLKNAENENTEDPEDGA